MNLKFRTEIAPILPTQPGVYLMKDKDGKIIYVGKAKNIKKRVSSYFSGKKGTKTSLLVKAISSIDFIITKKESEALLLENNLIKKHTPRYNIDLKDGKTYPMLRITNEKWPRIFKTRNIINDGSKYFGPFTDISMLDITIDLIKKLFPIRRCKGKLKTRTQPCLYFHLNQCSAPCIKAITEKEYKQIIEKIENLISGNDQQFEKNLQAGMKESASQLEFEKAAWYRDALSSLQKLRERQNIIDFDLEVRDYVSFIIDKEKAIFSIFQMREGKMSGRDLIPLSPILNEEDAIRQFIIQYYNQYHSPPAKIILQPSLTSLGLQTKSNLENFPYFDSKSFLSELNIISRHLSSSQDYKVTITIAKTDREQSIIQMGIENCRHGFYKRHRKGENNSGLTELSKVLGLSKKPVRIEGFDIAQLHGKHTVASLIHFHNGVPKRSQYRSFNIRSLKGKIDDFEAIKEAVARRYSRLKNEKKPLPHLILIDGGAGQVSAATEILSALELKIPVIGLAKKEEIIYRPHPLQPIILPEGNDALMLLQAVRDETHRFATTKSRKKREADLTFKVLESVKGIGQTKSKLLMKKYESLKKISQQSIAQITNDCNISTKVATELLEKVKEHLKIN